MALISIIIPTQRRPAPLAMALGSALRQTGLTGHDIEVVVVDNDQVASAREGVEAHQAKAASSGMRLVYIHEPRTGVANARNAAMAKASGDLIAFLDDDEEATEGWLARLASTQALFDADVVFGPVHARIPETVRHNRAYLTRFFSRQDKAETGLIDHYYGCGNSLLRRAALFDPVSPFSAERNHIGGEDDLLFGTMQAAGTRFAWAAEAVVYEDPAPSRLTLRYTLARAFAYGQGPTSHCAARTPPDRLGMARWMVIGMAQAIVYGGIGILTWALRRPDAANFLDQAARGLGKTFWGGPMKIAFYGTKS